MHFGKKNARLEYNMSLPVSLPVSLPASESGPVLDDSVSTITSTANYYVAPYVAALDTSGTAVLTAVQLSQLAVTIANIQRTFKITLTNMQTAALLNAFTVSKNGEHLTVALDESAFVAVFDNVIDGALDDAAAAVAADPANGLKGRLAKPAAKVADWLSHGLKNTLVDYILRTLKVSAEVSSAPVTVNAGSSASTDMYDGLAASSDVLEAIYLQISQPTLELYRVDNIPTTNALPLQGGDKMVFVFDTAPLTVTTSVSQTQQNASDAAGGAGGDAMVATLPNKYAQAANGTIVMTDTYRVAFEVTMFGSGAFAVEAPGVSVAGKSSLRGVAASYWNYAP
jgi:hypothetical protein